MLNEILLAAVRHGLGALGGALADNGIATGDELQKALGAGAFLASFGWSVYRKVQRRNAELAAKAGK